MTDHKYRDTMMSTAPVIDLLYGTPTRQHRAGRGHFVAQLSCWSGRQVVLPVWSEAPLVQPEKAIAAGVLRGIVRTRNVTVK
jgi:hypothetical protein